MRRVLLLLIVSFFVLITEAQNFTRPGDWKKYRKEIFISVGASNFLGDLGGRNQIGKDYSPVDLNFPETKTAFGLGYRYKLDTWINVVGKFNYLIVKGDDALTQEPYRNNRNLNFKSNIFELSGRVEIGYQSSKAGNRYGIKRTLGRRMKANTHSFFVFAGIGGFYYNPKGRAPNGKYIKLMPLHTEGQGLPGGPKKYTNYSICIPLGAFYKYTINKQWSVGLEISWRKTFTDYIDDVGTSYYDSTALATNFGPLAAVMADPNKHLITGQTSPDASGVAAQRGDKQKDSYVTLELTVGYIFKQKRKRARLRSKF
ncbi:MAG: hypothetical protein H0U95_11645 [Bacteroidetes bacterium]|nr:hypothetical protein [Bacteroidota bacterium]